MSDTAKSPISQYATDTAGNLINPPQLQGDDLGHYMESTSRLRAEREALRQNAIANGEQAQKWYKRAEAAEATMRQVAKELRAFSVEGVDYLGLRRIETLADRLSPPPVVEKPR